MSCDLNTFIKEQRDLLRLLEKYESRFEAKSCAEKTRGYVNALAERVDDIFHRFETQHDSITRLIHDTSLNIHDVPYMNEDVYFEFSEKYFTFKGKLIDSLPPHSIAQSPMTSTFIAHNSRSDTTIGFDSKLPKISLPKFSGEYMEWISFRDIYSSLVHRNDSLNKTQKFYYLKGTLTDEAANLIKNISTTEANYDSAWKILESRYHNKRMLVGTLISRLFNIPKSDGGFQSIKTLLDTAQESISSLGNLDVNTHNWDPIVVHLITQKLDPQSRRDWEQSLKSSTELPSLSELFLFLERTFRTLESLNEPPSITKSKFSKDDKNLSQDRKTSCNSVQFSKQKPLSCAFCEKNHTLSKCFKFLALSFNSKINFLTSKNVCRNCLVIGHDNNNCNSPFRCITCKQPHHTVLHLEESDNQISNNVGSVTNPSSFCNTTSPVTSHNAQSFSSVLLYTIRLNVVTNRGTFSLRALLDPGSQGSLISESTVQLLGLEKKKSHCKVIGIGNGCENVSKFLVDIDLFSRKHEPVLSCSALVLPNLSSYTPDPSTEHISMPNIDSESLADPLFYRSDSIDLILGSDVCSRIKIPSESFVHKDLFFQNTCFGWVFSGRNNSISASRVHIHNVNLEDILRSFWEQEEVITKRKLTSEEQACENYFKTTTSRTESGRYMVRFKSILNDGVDPVLQNNVISAFRRLRQVEISFSKRPLYSESYKSFMREYESLGHMSKIGYYPKDVRPNSYFLPHHGVLKESSSTTKLRVVFDGSSHINDDNSLNHELSPGPALQNDLPGILTKWRRHRIAFSADIEKMFRQIDVCPEHRKFQQILWRVSPYDEISIYELNTATYGTASAPYLAIRVLQQLADDYNIDCQQAARVLVYDSYVDDIISGADSLENAIPLYKDLCALLKKGGCNLRKWITNSKELLEEIPEDHRETSVTLKFDRDSIVKTLGIQWNTSVDSFSFIANLDENHTASKRTILSESAKLYDPLGWLTPSTVVAKSSFKQLWEHGVDWDDKIPIEIENQWLKHRLSLPKLANLKIPRYIQWSRDTKTELHCFCDASNTAYAAVVYSRIITQNEIFVNILQSKSKVSPIKVVSIPRLELCAAALAVTLTQKIKESLTDLDVQNIFYWSDSSTVLSWIRKPPSNWTVYVANRVADIQRLSNPIQWKYVPSTLNPADCASRGILAEDLIENRTWWFGPRFLYEPPSLWPKSLNNLHTFEEERKTRISTNCSTKKEYPEILLKFSKLQTILRVSCLCLRFIHNCKNSHLKITGPLTTSEMNNTLITFVKLTQAIDFPEEILKLSTNREIKHSSILKLMPFIDDDGIIRVGGRLQNSDLPYNKKHPLILSKANPLSKLIITDAHERTLHGGVTLTMSFVNRRYWTVSGNQLAKCIIHKCMRCFKFTAKTSQQIMGNLPLVRLNLTRPFKHSGVDYAGPILIKNSNLRSAAISKGYICLFVCMVTKAIHLEAVSGLTTNSFLAAFRRFISRRGACTDIYSDCGTNFVGASKELQVLHNRSQKSLPDELRQALSLNLTNWHFIPPASPNFGGLWEAGVKSVKYHLKRITNDRHLTFEELTTLLCQIESCLNSRPLCPLSTDPSDLDALTPAHFLVGEPTNCIQEEYLLDLNINRLTRWKSVEKMKQHFWKRWHGEYLNRLQARPKWLKSRPDAKIGDLVLVADERCGPGQWILGRIQDVHPGADGRTRVTIHLKLRKVFQPTYKTELESKVADGAYCKRCESEHSGVYNSNKTLPTIGHPRIYSVVIPNIRS